MRLLPLSGVRPDEYWLESWRYSTNNTWALLNKDVKEHDGA
jgi:hypothetical protein